MDVLSSPNREHNLHIPYPTNHSIQIESNIAKKSNYRGHKRKNIYQN